MKKLELKHIKETSNKQLWFGGIFVVASISMWAFLFWVFITQNASTTVILALLAASLLWAIFFNLTTLFLDKTPAFIAYTLSLVALLAFFGLYGFTAVGVIIFGATIFWAYKKTQNEKKNLIEFKSFRIARRSLPIFFIGLSIFLAFALNGLVLHDFYEEEVTIPPVIYDAMFEPVEIILSVMFSDYQKGMSIQEFQQMTLGLFIQPEILEEVGGTALFSSSLVDQEIASQSLRDFSYNWIDSSIDNIIEPFRGLLPFFFIVALFFVFNTFSFPFRWLAFGLSVVAVKVLLLYNVVTSTQTPSVKKEVIMQ